MKPGAQLQAERALEVMRCAADAQYYLFDSGYVMTKDEHDTRQPIKPFPDTVYLRVVLDALLLTAGLIPPERARWMVQADLDPIPFYRAGVLAIEKSRQIMATWIVAGYAQWRAKFKPHQLVLWQSKKEEDAANVVFNNDPLSARMSFMEYSLPPWLQSRIFPKGASRCNLRYPEGSRIWGIPEGGDIVRSNAPSLLVSDEAAFQPEFEAAVGAAMPAVKGGGQLVALSSAAPGAFARWVGVEGA